MCIIIVYHVFFYVLSNHGMYIEFYQVMCVIAACSHEISAYLYMCSSCNIIIVCKNTSPDFTGDLSEQHVLSNPGKSQHLQSFAE